MNEVSHWLDCFSSLLISFSIRTTLPNYLMGKFMDYGFSIRATLPHYLMIFFDIYIYLKKYYVKCVILV